MRITTKRAGAYVPGFHPIITFRAWWNARQTAKLLEHATGDEYEKLVDALQQKAETRGFKFTRLDNPSREVKLSALDNGKGEE